MLALSGGTSGLDYSVVSGSGTTCTSGLAGPTTCTVQTTFAPVVPGTRPGAVELIDSNGNLVASTLVSGLGAAPQIVFIGNNIGADVLGGQGGVFTGVNGVAVDGAGNVYAATADDQVVTEMPPNCANSGCVKQLGVGWNYPVGVAVDGAGNVYVADSHANTVAEMPPNCFSSACVTSLGGGFDSPTDVAVDGSGNVYVANNLGNSVTVMPPNCAGSSCVTTLGGDFEQPWGVAVDSAGNVYVSDASSNGAVKEMTPDCTSSACVTALGSGYHLPRDLAVEPGGSVYVADTYNGRVTLMSPACNGAPCVTPLGYSYSYPTGMALDGVGNVYVGDTNDYEVKELTLATPPTLEFSGTVVGQTSGSQTFVAENIGNEALAFTGIVASTGFTVDPSTTCSTSTPLAAGETCTVAVDFAPTSASANGGMLTLTDNALNGSAATQVISLVGVGEPAITTTRVQPSNSPSTYGQAVSFFVTVSAAGDITPTGSVQFVIDGTNFGAPVPLVSGSATSGSTFTLTAGSHLVSAVYQPSSGFEASSSTFDQVVSAAAPTINWATPTSIIYGTPLSLAQLNATASFNGNPVTGTFTYTPALGTILSAGSGQTLSVSFAPSNSNYSTVNASVLITVSPAAPTINWAAPTPITYGTPLSAAQLDATATFNGNPVTGTFTYTPALGTILSAGSGQTLSVSFTPNSSNYTTANASVLITVNPAAPTINWAAPTPITYGTPLSAAQLDATATFNGNPVTGTFTYTPALGTILSAGSGQTLSVSFTPNSSNYTTANASVLITVNKAAPTINWPTPTPITYGTALSAAQLDATATFNGSPVTGTFTYTPALGTILSGGVGQTLSVSFAPSSSNYSTANGSVLITVNKASQTITFTLPAGVNYGVAPIALPATASSGLPITYTVTSGPGTITGTAAAPTLTITGSGTVKVTASQAGNGNYLAATSVTATTVVTAVPLASILPASVNLGNPYLGQIVTQTITVTNVGDATMTINNPLIAILQGGNSSEFSTLNQCPGSLAAGKSCTMTVTFVAGPFFNPQTATLDTIPTRQAVRRRSCSPLRSSIRSLCTAGPASPLAR